MKTFLLALVFSFSAFAFADDYVINSDGGIDLTALSSVIIQAGGDGPMLLQTQNTSDIDIFAGGNIVLFPQYGTLIAVNLQIYPTTSDCNSATAGSFNYVAGDSGVPDQLQVCLKAADDTYSWKNVSF